MWRFTVRQARLSHWCRSFWKMSDSGSVLVSINILWCSIVVGLMFVSRIFAKRLKGKRGCSCSFYSGQCLAMNRQSLCWMSLVLALLCVHLPEPSEMNQLIHFNSKEHNCRRCWKSSAQRHASHIEGPWNYHETALGGRRTALGWGREGNNNNFSPLLVKRCQELQDDQSVSNRMLF